MSHFCHLMTLSPPFALCSGLQFTHLHVGDDTSKPVNIGILFLQKSC